MTTDKYRIEIHEIENNKLVYRVEFAKPYAKAIQLAGKYPTAHIKIFDLDGNKVYETGVEPQTPPDITPI